MMLGSEFNQPQASRSELSKTILRVMKIGKESYPFSEFRGLGLPGVDLGQPGDIYIDITPGLHALYGRYPESWMLWPGANDASNLLRHPLRSDRCLWCHTTVSWIHPSYARVNSVNASELLSEALKSQGKVSEESKKRKRESLLQPIRTEVPSFTTNTSSPSQGRNSVENQSATDALPFLSSKMPYSQPAHEIMISRTLTPTDISTIQNSDCSKSPTTPRRRFIPPETDAISTSHNLNGLSVRNPQEQYTSPKWIDLRKRYISHSLNGLSVRNSQEQYTSPKRIDFRKRFIPPETDPMFTPHNLNGLSVRSPQEQYTSQKRIDLRKIAKSQRRLSLPTHTKSISYPAYEEQSPSQPSIHNSETLRIFRNDDSPLGSAQTSSTATFREPFVNDTDPENFPVKPFSLDLSDITGGGFVTKNLPYSASVASTNSVLSAEVTQRSHPNNGLALEIAIAKLKKVKDAFDANAANLREANDKIHRLEAENAKLRAQLLTQRRSNSPPADIPLMITNVEMPPAADSHGPSGAEELIQSRRELTGPLESVGDIPQLYPRHSPCEELESSLAPEHLATPPPSLLLADTSISTETTSSVQVLPPTESATVECRNTTDILNVEADTLSLDECKSESAMNTCSPVKDVIPCDASTVPTSTLPRMREIHRSVLFAKAGTLFICRICLGTKLEEIETLDQAFQISEDSPELMQEHYEKEHPIDFEAVLNMSDEDLVDVVSMLSTEY